MRKIKPSRSSRTAFQELAGKTEQLATRETHHKAASGIARQSRKRGREARAAALKEITTRNVRTVVRELAASTPLPAALPTVTVDWKSKTPAVSSTDSLRFIQGAATLKAQYGVPKYVHAAAHGLSESWERQKVKRVRISERDSLAPLPPGPARGERRRFIPGSQEQKDFWTAATSTYCFASQEKLGLKFGMSQKSVSRELTVYRKEQGLLPILSKKTVPICKQANLPRVLDMHSGYLVWEAKRSRLGEEVVYQDETPLRWGDGNHAQQGRAQAGTQVHLNI